MKRFLLLATFLLSTNIFAATEHTEHHLGKGYVEKATELEGTLDGTIPVKPGLESGSGSGSYEGGYYGGYHRDGIGQVGRVVAVGREIVALGEAIYDLVQRSKPTNTTEYAPISVVPYDRATSQMVSPFELENFSIPQSKTYMAIIKNISGKVVVTVKYRVIYSHGGTFNGKGRYLTNVMVVPSEIKTSFGWNVNMLMKVGNVMNHGTVANPNAGILLMVKYQITSMGVAYERNDTIHVAGTGDVNVLDAKYSGF